MSALLKALALQLVAGRTVGGIFTLLVAVLAPLAGVLKFIGLPILLVLAIVGAPLFLLLGAVGLPSMLVVGIGGVILLFVAAIAALGILALKIVIPVVLVILAVRWLLGRHRAAESPVRGN